jgi:hypothetical protein
VSDILHANGFFGTNANFATDMALALSVLVAIVFTSGTVLALKHHYAWHRWLQTTGAVINTVLVLWLMVIPYFDFVVRDFGAPVRPSSFYWITTVHAIIGFVTFLFGNFVVLRGNNLMIERLKFTNYKPYMRVAYALYMIATLLGIGVYINWFIMIPNPPVFN